MRLGRREQPAGPPEPRPPHADRFVSVIAGLGGIAVGAIAIAVAVILTSSSSSASSQWSAWTPTTGAGSIPSQIAAHVSPLYRLTAAAQLDVVSTITLGNAAATTDPGTLVAVSSADSGDENLSLLTGSTVAYNLCGLGSGNCTLAGTASADRLLLLRREALELALYTFEYDLGTQYVIAVLPPGHTGSGSTPTATLGQTLPSRATATKSTPLTVAVLFARSELAPYLASPIGATLAQYPPDIAELPAWRSTQEAGFVDQITAEGLFSEKMEAQQTGGNLLVLDPLPPQ